MPKKIVAGNWKMNKTHEEALSLSKELFDRQDEIPEDVKLVISPPALYLSSMAHISKSRIGLSSQNCSNQKSGAFTGEISTEMLNSVGVKFCIVGHSERRSYYSESDEFIGEKVERLLEDDITPIFCCGEQLEERESDQYFDIIKNQISNSLFHLSKEEISKLVIAYEPVWAIGTGKTASPEQAQEIHAYIRSLISEKYDSEIGDNLSILYGGSCKPSNAKELFSQPDIDGGLIGGASLNADDFLALSKSF